MGASQHICPRCGTEDNCEYGSWPDRHPVMATIAGLFTLTFMGMMFAVYTSAAFTMTVLAAGIYGVRVYSRDQRRRRGIAARAEYEHRELMQRQAMPEIRLTPHDPIPARTQPPIVMPAPMTQPIRNRR